MEKFYSLSLKKLRNRGCKVLLSKKVEKRTEGDSDWESKKKQVTRGHNIVADGWAGASNLQPHPTPIPNTPPTHSHSLNNNCSIINARFSRFQLKKDN